MATFPESPAPLYPLTVTPRWKTFISPQGGATEQRRRLAEFAVYDVTVSYNALSPTDIATLYNFYMARKGAWDAFYIYDLSLLEGTTHQHYDQYIGVGDGATEVFDIPGRSTSSQVIYVDGVEQTVTTDYVISIGTGLSSSDQVDFVSAPSSGAVITCDFAGYLRMRVRFAEDKMSRDLFQYRLYTTGLSMYGLPAA